jgi:hypothetical protein
MKTKYLLRQFAEQSLAMEKTLDAMARILLTMGDCAQVDPVLDEAIRRIRIEQREFTESLQQSARQCESCKGTCKKACMTV